MNAAKQFANFRGNPLFQATNGQTVITIEENNERIENTWLWVAAEKEGGQETDENYCC